MARPNSWVEIAALSFVIGLVGLLLLPASCVAQGAGVTHPTGPGEPSPAPLARGPEVAVPHPGADGSAPWPGTAAPAHGLSLHPVLAMSQRSHPSIVNPVQFYTREPAPMGIADFGVTGKAPGGSAYSYSTSSFQGQAVVRSLSVTIGGTSSKVTAFELNSVVVFQRNGASYAYWIQNGLHLDAGSDQFTIGGAYVWNFSAPGATLSSGELRGATGSVLASDTYYYIPACGPMYPGQCSTVGLPAVLTGRTVTSSSAGIPYVDFEYNIGSGWVTYDNVSFPRLVNASASGFRVDGFSPTPYAAGLYYDAEWVWVGAGGGSASTDLESDITLSLSWWNGHNYQDVPTAWDFGSNTGETSSNVSEVATDPLGAHLSAGAGTLGPLYNLSTVGFLDLAAPTPGAATVLVDGQAVPFEGGAANITLTAGTHSLYLQNFSNASAQFTITPGAVTLVNLTGAGEIVLNESGLPPNTTWGVQVSGTTLTTSGSALRLNLANGTYAVTYTAVPGYFPLGSDPASLTLPGATQVSLLFAPFTYAVTVTESGLPPSVPWWVNVSGTRVQSTATSLEVMAPNGSTPYEVGSVYEFLATPDRGSILVSAGVASPVSVVFAYRPAYIVGTIVPAHASVSIDGVAQALAGGRFNASVIPGSYELVASASGYISDRVTVTATAGNYTWENLSLAVNSTHGPGTSAAPGGGVSALTVALAGVAVAAVAAVGVLLYLRRRR